MGITLYYNAACPRCARQARLTQRLDWLRSVQISTQESPIGTVPPGQIVVTDHDSQRNYTGIYAVRSVSMRVPAYVLWGLILYIPPIRRLAGRNKPGCNGDACEI